MALLVVVHVFANMLWIGSIACVGWLVASVGSAPSDDAGRIAAELGHGVFKRVAAPALTIVLVTGVARMLMDPKTSYMSLHWFQGKLAAVLAVVTLHHVIGVRAKRRMAPSGSRQADKSSAILTFATLAGAFVAVTFAVLKGQLGP